ncbi:uncharacterized protein LOC122617559 [Drosophila teissieri]|uniref:uncharacterized protein LOC122617559 n=1 Tax=Drosophila teissieri TaxID=7243 RepID=UPI001CBA0779|nr:uncharacterized protein LOC122617559 [Drosophila teissieri]
MVALYQRFQSEKQSTLSESLVEWASSISRCFFESRYARYQKRCVQWRLVWLSKEQRTINPFGDVGLRDQILKLRLLRLASSGPSDRLYRTLLSRRTPTSAAISSMRGIESSLSAATLLFAATGNAVISSPIRVRMDFLKNHIKANGEAGLKALI